MMRITSHVKYLALSLLLLVSLVLSPLALARAAAVSGNLLADPGFETPSTSGPTTPANWTPESWGTNSVNFTYSSNAHTGSYAAETTVSNYQSGDAKWMPDAVSVNSNAQYTYSDWYEATASTNLWAAFQLNNGTTQYQWLSTLSPVASWTQANVTLTTPANATAASLFHVLNTNGDLTIDDASLTLVPPTDNLIANSGFETSNGNTPANWTPESWGTNSVNFTYSSNAHTGSYAAETTVSNYQSGDAKWAFNPIPVNASTQYTYTDWYESTTATNVWAQFTLSDGTTQYQWLGGLNPASSWMQTNLAFTTPANVSTLTIFHVLNANGDLTIDDVSLMATPACSVSNANGIYNGGFEQTCPDSPNMPAGWLTESYGSPNATYTYTTTAHSGNYAVATNMQGPSGEAGWQTSWQNVASNQRYNLSFWQIGTAYVYAYVAIRLTNGNLQYTSLMSVPATQNTGWSQYSDSFVTPANSSQVQITIATSEPGYFYLDDVYLTALSNQNPANFNQGMVSLTFDDGDASSYNNGYTELQSLGLTGTFYVNGGTLGTKGYMSTANVKTMANAGDEIGSHEYQHLDLVTLTQPQLNSELSQNNTVLHNILGANYPLTDFASPYGSYTSNVLNTVMSYYQAHRTTDGEFNTKANLNPRTLHAVLVTSSTSVTQVKAWINQAEQQHTWLILVYHAVGSSPLGGDGDGYSTTPTHFNSEMTYLKSQAGNVGILPVNSALAALQAQE